MLYCVPKPGTDVLPLQPTVDQTQPLRAPWNTSIPPAMRLPLWRSGERTATTIRLQKLDRLGEGVGSCLNFDVGRTPTDFVVVDGYHPARIVWIGARQICWIPTGIFRLYRVAVDAPEPPPLHPIDWLQHYIALHAETRRYAKSFQRIWCDLRRIPRGARDQLHKRSVQPTLSQGCRLRQHCNFYAISPR